MNTNLTKLYFLIITGLLQKDKLTTEQLSIISFDQLKAEEQAHILGEIFHSEGVPEDMGVFDTDAINDYFVSIGFLDDFGSTGIKFYGKNGPYSNQCARIFACLLVNDSGNDNCTIYLRNPRQLENAMVSDFLSFITHQFGPKNISMKLEL